MTTLYAESSAVLRWLLGAPEASSIQASLGNAAEVVTSALTAAEVRCTLRRLAAAGTLTPDARDRAIARFIHASARWIVHRVTDEVLTRTGESFPLEPLRTLDAVHIATAEFHSREIRPTTMLSFDVRVRASAEAVGLAVYPAKLR
jgi:predicted nucleic acid-binding protein